MKKEFKYNFFYKDNVSLESQIEPILLNYIKEYLNNFEGSII